MYRVLLLVSLTACDRPPPTHAARDVMVGLHMRGNFGLVHAIEQRLIRGQLDEARSLAQAIANTPDEPALDAWAAQEAAIRDRANAIVHARSVDDALRAEVELATSCAGCHASAQVHAELGQAPKVPADLGTVPARMARHAWATDRLWEGMLGASDEPWRAGLQVLAAEPIEGLPPDRAPFAPQLQAHARDALAGPQQDPAARAKNYATILGDCRGCHAPKTL